MVTDDARKFEKVPDLRIEEWAIHYDSLPPHHEPRASTSPLLPILVCLSFFRQSDRQKCLLIS